MANVLDLIGRIFISALFLISAYNKIFSIRWNNELDGRFWSTWFFNLSNYSN